jgi:hypothetical protein
MNDAGVLISGGALIVSFFALTLAVVSNFRVHSLHQRQLHLETRLRRLETPAAG